MNKSNKILLGVLSFVVVCVVGYALFSETITVTGTATASGNFDIITTCQTGIPSIASAAASALNLKTESGYSEDSCNVIDDTKFSFNTNLLYPSAARIFTLKITNNGNITATLVPADEPSIFSTVLFKNTNSNVCEINSNNQKVNCTDSLNYNNGTSGFISDIILGMTKADGSFFSADDPDNMVDFFNEDTGMLEIKPKEAMYVALTMYWSEDYVSNNNKANLSFEVSADINFTQ